MKNRIAIFAHYDRDCVVDDYVIEYLHRLKKVVDHIVFVSDCNLNEQEKQKLAPLCLDIIASRHQEYDFGSHKRGFNLLKEKYSEKLSSISELVLANDSCFAIRDFDEIFKNMESKTDIDVWGITDNDEYCYHLQSYFLVFRKSVFLENFFINYLNAIKHIKDKHELVVAYEIGLAKTLLENNKKIFAYFGKNIIEKYIEENSAEIKNEISEVFGAYKYCFSNDFLYKIISTLGWSYCRSDALFVLVKMGCPLLKNRFSKKKIIPLFGEKILKKYANYDVTLINQYRKRISGKSLMTRSEFTRSRLILFFLIRDFFKKILGCKRYKI